MSLPDKTNNAQNEAVFNADVIIHILTFCSKTTLSSLARVSKDIQSLTTPVLYRHLSLDVDNSSDLLIDICSGPHNVDDLGSNHIDSDSARFVHTRSLLIRPHHWGTCASHSLPIHLPNLDSLHFQINRFTYHWPHGCPLIPALEPAPRELIVSATDDCDILYWTFGSRCYDNLPKGVERLVLRLNGRSKVREWKLCALIRGIQHNTPVEIIVESADEEDGMILENIAVLALSRPTKLIIRKRPGKGGKDSGKVANERNVDDALSIEARRERVFSVMRELSGELGMGEEELEDAMAPVEVG